MCIIGEETEEMVSITLWCYVVHATQALGAMERQEGHHPPSVRKPKEGLWQGQETNVNAPAHAVVTRSSTTYWFEVELQLPC